MEEKQLAYQDYLSKISDCPSNDCSEKERDSFRWVHNPVKEEDFIPVAFENSRRVLDETDQQQCMSYGLSLFDSLDHAIKQYKKIYENQRTTLRQQEWRTNKGENVAHIPLKLDDGISSESNKNGHFTFYSYMNVNLLKNVRTIFDIFSDNGSDSANKQSG